MSSNMLPKSIQDFLKQNIDLLKSDNMDELFAKAEHEYRSNSSPFSPSDIRRVLEDANINILDKLDSIPYGYFQDDKTLYGIIIPEHITVIQAEAFSDCRFLEKVTLPKNLREIQDYAFSYCPRLKYIELPNTLEFIFSNAFYAAGLEKCRFLGTIDQFKAIELGDTIFDGCDHLSHIICDDGLIDLEDGDPILE